mmetsp:Transcript_28586/g.73343  ORF Transcript_28586/g.73343 Transcript_28586/m.73343 type:complete len:86 (+) Transcript_28586:1254-1511(+)
MLSASSTWQQHHHSGWHAVCGCQARALRERSRGVADPLAGLPVDVQTTEACSRLHVVRVDRERAAQLLMACAICTGPPGAHARLC